YEVWSPGPMENPVTAANVLASGIAFKRSGAKNEAGKGWETIFNTEVDETMRESADEQLVLGDAFDPSGRPLTGHRNQLKLAEFSRRPDDNNMILDLPAVLKPLVAAFRDFHKIPARLELNTPVLLFCDEGTPMQSLHRDWPRHLCNPGVETLTRQQLEARRLAEERERLAQERRQRPGGGARAAPGGGSRAAPGGGARAAPGGGSRAAPGGGARAAPGGGARASRLDRPQPVGAPPKVRSAEPVLTPAELASAKAAVAEFKKEHGSKRSIRWPLERPHIIEGDSPEPDAEDSFHLTLKSPLMTSPALPHGWMYWQYMRKQNPMKPDTAVFRAPGGKRHRRLLEAKPEILKVLPSFDEDKFEVDRLGLVALLQAVLVKEKDESVLRDPRVLPGVVKTFWKFPREEEGGEKKAEKQMPWSAKKEGGGGKEEVEEEEDLDFGEDSSEEEEQKQGEEEDQEEEEEMELEPDDDDDDEEEEEEEAWTESKPPSPRKRSRSPSPRKSPGFGEYEEEWEESEESAGEEADEDWRNEKRPARSGSKERRGGERSRKRTVDGAGLQEGVTYEDAEVPAHILPPPQTARKPPAVREPLPPPPPDLGCPKCRFAARGCAGCRSPSRSPSLSPTLSPTPKAQWGWTPSHTPKFPACGESPVYKIESMGEGYYFFIHTENNSNSATGRKQRFRNLFLGKSGPVDSFVKLLRTNNLEDARGDFERGWKAQAEAVREALKRRAPPAELLAISGALQRGEVPEVFP
ncbi:hypothetical protein TeGR_g14514, partial [Tetraparma gracilis]